LAAIVAAKIPRLIFSSTAAVYDPAYTTEPVTEDMPVRPVSVYGTTKLMVEEMIQAYARTGHLPHYTILRYFNVAGDAGLDYREEAAQNVFPVIARTLTSAQPFTIFGTDYATPDGTCIRDYIHLRDLVAGHVAALEAPESGIFNLGTGTGYSVRELVAAFDAALPAPLQATEQARRPGDAPQVVADSLRARTILGWQPRHTLKEMVEDTLRVYR
jgi:UDP-glucose 4-epimerase